MKRKKIRPKKPHSTANKARTATSTPAEPDQPTRRHAMATIRNWGLVGIAVAGSGWYLIDEVTATIAEHDLSRIGNGTPAVVQIHDPQCPRCIALQKEAREAMEQFGGGELQYLVANIRSEKGRKLADTHGVPHVTLLLMDADGKRQTTITGPSTAQALTMSFRAHVNRFSGS